MRTMKKGKLMDKEQKAEIDKLTKIIADQEKIIKDQEKEIASLKGQVKAFQPIVNAWSARQRPARDDYYED